MVISSAVDLVVTLGGLDRGFGVDFPFAAESGADESATVCPGTNSGASALRLASCSVWSLSATDPSSAGPCLVSCPPNALPPTTAEPLFLGVLRLPLPLSVLLFVAGCSVFSVRLALPPLPPLLPLGLRLLDVSAGPCSSFDAEVLACCAGT